MAEQKIDAKYLEGLKFRGAEIKKVKTDAGDKEKSVPFERDLTADDVLDWKDKGDSVVIVTADGQKHTVARKKGK